jgi:hypothetical protein
MGVCSHPEFADDFYVHSRGGKKLVADANVPSGFQWIGVQNRGGSEYVFAMWRDHERWFWFYDQFVVYYANSSASTERTQRRLSNALERWRSGETTVVYSGPWGWFDPQSGLFDKDDKRRELEEWDAFSQEDRIRAMRESIEQVFRTNLEKPPDGPVE